MGRFNKGASTNLIYIVSDCIFGGIAFLLAVILSGEYEALYKGSYIITLLMFMTIFILANKESRLYNVTTFFYTDRIIRCVSKSFFITTGIISTLVFYVGRAKTDIAFYIWFLVIVYVFMLCSAFLVHYLIKRINHFAPRTMLVGKIEYYDKFEDYMHKSNMDINVVGYVSFDRREEKGYLGCIEDLESLIHDNGIDQVYIMNHNKNMKDIQTYIDMCIEMGVTARIVMNFYRAEGIQSYVSSVGTYPVITYHTISLNRTSRALKRTIDIIGSLVGIMSTLPIMIIAAIAIKIETEGPVIFKQKRVGMNGRHFNIYKFRSMCNDAEERKKSLMKQNEMGDHFMFKMQDDPRVTKVGKFIRKTSIDELPQFFNVLFGQMSLVGTRPPTVDEVDRYERNHWRRMSIKPGITGMWQVRGRSEITDFREIVEMDVEYIDNWNVILDFRIMIKTIYQVFTRNGAY